MDVQAQPHPILPGAEVASAPLAKLPHVMFFGGGVVIKFDDEVIGSK